MRNPFEVRESRYDWANKLSPNMQASSPDQLAVCWNNSNEVIAASPATADTGGSYDMDITRLPADFDLAAALNMRREKNLGVPPLSAQTHYLTIVPNFNERTRILALDGSTLALNDDDLTEWLIEAERQVIIGTDNHPIFETSLQDTACAIDRLPNGLVAMTEVPRQALQLARDKVQPLAGAAGSTNLSFAIETPLRTAARYFLTALPEGASALRPEKDREVTAFLLITKAGFNYGLWSPAAGLFTEYGFLSPTEINQPGGGFQRFGAARIIESESASASPEAQEARLEAHNLEAYIRHAFDQLFLQMSPETLAQLQLNAYSQVVWAAEMGLSETVSAIAAEFAEKTGLDFHRIGVPVDEAIAGGLLFGSFNFGDDTVAGAEIVPPVNLARDLLVLADTEEIERRRVDEMSAVKHRSRTIFALVAMPVVVVAVLLGLIADIIRTQFMLGVRDVRAEMRASELKPALDRRNGYEANLKWYQEFIKQVSNLRRQQPVGTGMLYELNPSYPFTADPGFYISELRLLPTGGVEIKGLARNKDAVTSFLRSLEFSGGTQSGTKLFSNLTYEVQEGVAQQVITPPPGSTLPTLAGTNLGTNKPAPGIISWSIRGNYVPVGEFIPPDPSKNKPGAPAVPNAAAPVPPTAAAPNNQPPATATTTAPKTNP